MKGSVKPVMMAKGIASSLVSRTVRRAAMVSDVGSTWSHNGCGTATGLSADLVTVLRLGESNLTATGSGLPTGSGKPPSVHYRDESVFMAAGDPFIDSVSAVTMAARNPETADRIALEIDFDPHHRFVAHDPPVMARLDG